MLVNASHPTPWTSGRTLTAIWLDPPDWAAATNPAAITGTATASSTVTSRPIIDRASLTSSARIAVVTGSTPDEAASTVRKNCRSRSTPSGGSVPTIRPSCITLMIEASRAISSRW